MKWFLEDENKVPVNNVLTGYGDRSLMPFFFGSMQIAYNICAALNKRYNCIGKFYSVVSTD